MNQNPTIGEVAESDRERITALLQALEQGERGVVDELFRLVYQELRGVARRQRRRWRGDFTLNTTALVHEAYLKLVDQKRVVAESRAHFLALAAKAMRHILANYATRRRAAKRGGDQQVVSLDDVELAAVGEANVMPSERADTMVALEEALKRLEQVSPRRTQIVECRVFGGMTVDETATALNISPATVKRDWAVAQSWLFREMHRES
jgi:RNA polymerase sigma factor (TIGR02999 family)